VEFDFFVKSSSIVVECQGLHHYHDVLLYGEKFNREDLDLEKVKLCAEHGFTLIEIPYWWDLDRSSFQRTLFEFRTVKKHF